MRHEADPHSPSRRRPDDRPAYEPAIERLLEMIRNELDLCPAMWQWVNHALDAVQNGGRLDMPPDLWTDNLKELYSENQCGCDEFGCRACC